MDYSVFNALAYNTTDPQTGKSLKQALIVYDIACQYSVNFKKRYQASQILQMIYSWCILTLVWAIGKFHLGAHKEECYPQYSLNHKEGSGQHEGEGAERAWSFLNGITESTTTASLASRQEHTDGGMQDNNWKIISSLGETRIFCVDHQSLTFNFQPMPLERNIKKQCRHIRTLRQPLISFAKQLRKVI